MRRRFRWNAELGRQEEIFSSNPISGVMIMPDIEPFVSPIDGKVISGRRALAEHNKRHNVTNAADFTNEWKEAEKKRAKFYTGEANVDGARRREALVHAYETLRRK